MRPLLLASVFALSASAVFAQEAATFDNPSPVNFDRPFLSYGVTVRVPAGPKDSAIPVEVIGYEELPRVLNLQGAPIDQFLRENPKLTAPEDRRGGAGRTNAPDAKDSPKD